MNIGQRQRLIKKSAEIAKILAKYGVRTVRIYGAPDCDYEVEPDVDLLVSFDKKDWGMVLLCLRDGFRKSDRITLEGDPDGIELSLSLTRILYCFVNVCWAASIANFHPETYEKTRISHKWPPPVDARWRIL